MAITKFIPEVWSSKIITTFREKAIFATLVSRDYEGEAKSGNTVHIPGIVDVAVKDYKAAGRTTSADAITDTGVDLLIDQEKNFDFYVDDIDNAQSSSKLMTPYAESAALGLVEDADKFLAALAVTGGVAVAPAVAPTDAATAWDTLRKLRLQMDKAKVPTAQRYVVANAEFATLLLDNDSKITAVDTSGSPEGLREGVIGRILGFDVYGSENLPTTTKPQLVGFHKSSLAYASQIDKTEALRADNKFADRLRGLHVYGGKIVRPTAVFQFTAA